MDGWFGPGGSLARLFGPRYEPREQQAAMASLVRGTLRNGGLALIEAGTGTGKSLAYLIPLVEALSHHADRRAVVATYTIHLQEQLLARDIPAAVRVAGADVGAALAKGWSNYLCRLRLHHALHRPSGLLDLDLEPFQAQLNLLARWAAESPSGSRSELPEAVDPEVWQAVAADPDACTRKRCPHYETCFFFEARRQLHRARLVVANHHLLMADLVLRREHAAPEVRVLPDFEYLVVDEAHHLEDVAVERLGAQLAEKGVLQRLHRLARRREPSLSKAAGDAMQPFSELFEGLRASFGAACGDAGEARSRRLAPRQVEQNPVLARLLEQAVDALQGLAHVASGLASESPGAPDEEADQLAAELLGLARWADRTAYTLDFLVRAEEPEYVYWAEPAAGASRDLVLRAAPLDVGPVLFGELVAPRRASVFTSATLTTGPGDFGPLKRSLGLGRQAPYAGVPAGGSPQDAGPELAGDYETDERGVVRIRVGRAGSTLVREEAGLVEATFPSPFDFRRQAMVAVPVGLPPPDHEEFAVRVAVWVAGLARAIGGRTFVLFTSTRMLGEAASALEAAPQAEGLTVLRQGQAPRSQLLERFRAEAGAGFVLLGTDSFWEGVDVPGPALSCVVLARLPFPVPDQPLAQARAERLQAQGRNPFLEDAVPRAVLKFRQGFGRLIRTASDRGCVAVMDRRILTRPYGRRFLDALPPCNLVVGPADILQEELARWIGPPPS